MKTSGEWLVAAVLALLSLCGSAAADLDLSGIPNLGSDGSLDVTLNKVIDLSQAVEGSWTDAGDGNGIYDPERWVVVFKYSSVTVNANRSLTFQNHPSGAPVVWIVDGDVTLAGANANVILDGSAWVTGQLSEPGPGGFRGGRGQLANSPPSAGFGPGAGNFDESNNCSVSGGSFGAPGSAAPGVAAGATYGNEQLLPLVGGSGGAGRSGSGGGGGAGGGALLIVARSTITLGGGSGFYARGGLGNGSGGAGGGIRLVADTLTGSGALRATGGGSNCGHPGGAGRIRVDFLTSADLTDQGDPPISFGQSDAVPTLFAPDTAPTLRVVSVAGEPVPADPNADFAFPDPDVQYDSTDPIEVLVEAMNVPLDSEVVVRITPESGPPIELQAEFVGGRESISTWRVETLVGTGFAAVQARANLPQR